jgi:hypothetical protein
MTTRQFEAVLVTAIEQTDEMREGKIRSIETFEEVGMLTTDHGLVVGFTDGSEIQLTLVQSRTRRGDSR